METAVAHGIPFLERLSLKFFFFLKAIRAQLRIDKRTWIIDADA